MRIFLRILLGIILTLLAVSIGMNVLARNQRSDEAVYHKELPKTIRLETSRLGADSLLAQSCTCKGGEQSPDLYWRTGLPGVKSFALTMTDPDVPSPDFPLFNLAHWIVYDIPNTYSNLPDGLLAEQATRHGAQFGKNSLGDLKYIGPCPPVGRHVYVLKIYALDRRLVPKAPLEKQQLLDAMKGHILAYGELKVYYAAEK